MAEEERTVFSIVEIRAVTTPTWDHNYTTTPDNTQEPALQVQKPATETLVTFQNETSDPPAALVVQESQLTEAINSVAQESDRVDPVTIEAGRQEHNWLVDLGNSHSYSAP